MFRRIEAQIVLQGLTKKQLAGMVGIRYNTLLQKLNGSSQFTLDEALRVKEALDSDETLEVLFEKTNN